MAASKLTYRQKKARFEKNSQGWGELTLFRPEFFGSFLIEGGGGGR